MPFGRVGHARWFYLVDTIQRCLSVDNSRASRKKARWSSLVKDTCLSSKGTRVRIPHGPQGGKSWDKPDAPMGIHSGRGVPRDAPKRRWCKSNIPASQVGARGCEGLSTAPSGHSSMVEHCVANAKVVGSNPIVRSRRDYEKRYK